MCFWLVIKVTWPLAFCLIIPSKMCSNYHIMLCMTHLIIQYVTPAVLIPCKLLSQSFCGELSYTMQWLTVILFLRWALTSVVCINSVNKNVEMIKKLTVMIWSTNGSIKMWRAETGFTFGEIIVCHKLVRICAGSWLYRRHHSNKMW